MAAGCCPQARERQILHCNAVSDGYFLEQWDSGKRCKGRMESSDAPAGGYTAHFWEHHFCYYSGVHGRAEDLVTLMREYYVM